MVVTIRKVPRIGLLRPAVPFTGEDALAADRLKPKPQATNPGEQVDEPERRGIAIGDTAGCRAHHFARDPGRRRCIAGEVAFDLPGRESEKLGCFLKRLSGAPEGCRKSAGQVVHAGPRQIKTGSFPDINGTVSRGVKCSFNVHMGRAWYATTVEAWAPTDPSRARRTTEAKADVLPDDFGRRGSHDFRLERLRRFESAPDSMAPKTLRIATCSAAKTDR